MKKRKSIYHTVSRFFISTDTLTAVGVRDTYENGRYIYSKMSTTKCPTWDRNHLLCKLKTPLIPFFETMSMFEAVGDL